jgi:SulP family sulfate permease
VVLTAVAIGLDLDIRTVGDMGELPDSLPVFLLPDVPLTSRRCRSSCRSP